MSVAADEVAMAWASRSAERRRTTDLWVHVLVGVGLAAKGLSNDDLDRVRDALGFVLRQLVEFDAAMPEAWMVRRAIPDGRDRNYFRDFVVGFTARELDIDLDTWKYVS